MVTHHPSATSVDEAMLQMALRRNNANVELVSGNVTQRTNEQLVEMAEKQKMREMRAYADAAGGHQASQHGLQRPSLAARSTRSSRRRSARSSSWSTRACRST